ncbi:MAG TPA: FkbM family methyltransferase [Gemmatimonadaceae bacterium]|nr:FkbM family methyltransferase [Gemmatimonadaceae bacterium]
MITPPAKIVVGLRATPYLADHAVRDVVMVPGAFFVDVARSHDRERRGPGARIVRNVVFESPVILASDDTTIRVDVRESGANRWEYRFYDESVSAGSKSDAHVARLEIEIASTTPAASARAIDALKAGASDPIDRDRVYAALRENGNQYGPAFQRITSVWRGDERSLCELSFARENGAGAARDTIALDALAQTLASRSMEAGKTFVLRSIDELVLADGDVPDALWALASLDPQNTSSGAVESFDTTGATFARLSGVSFSLIDARGENDVLPPATVAIAANITAEPIEDSLRFWSDHFGMPLRFEFAPYNQVFQQLLDPASAFRTNRDGVNVAMIALEEWATAQTRRTLNVDRHRVQRALGTRTRRTLPNGLEIAHLNQYETDYVYKEVFEDQAYLRHGVRLHDGDTVVDIGANIGLFSLFVMSRCNNPRIIAFEPAPLVFDLLRANCAAYGSNVHAVNAGVSGAPGTATFTFYEKSSVFSGFHVDENEDREAIEAVVRNTLHAATSGDGSDVESYVEELTADRLQRTTYECCLTSVSEIIRTHKLDRIDLLKIDAERSELEIIRGIGDADWAKIRQIVMEVHDRSREMIGQIETLLAEKGFHCAVEHEDLLEHSGLFNVYATRDVAVTRSTMTALQQNVSDFSGALAAFMQQSPAPLVLCVCPPPPARNGDVPSHDDLAAAEGALLAAAAAIPGVHTIASTDALRRYPVAEYYDAHTHQLGHIPYTPAAYAALGTEVFRAMCRAKRTPFKALVLDCDNTLWSGVCGEDGADGVEITPSHRKLQEFVVEQANAGMLVCLCSKNTEQDVFDVFDRRADMVLRREHLASWRINWSGKSENIRAIARELSLGLDSFVFIDDSPVECAEVRHGCPSVLTLQLPERGDAVASFLDHVWAFDRGGATAEDRKRTLMYRQNAERERFRDQVMSLSDFVKGLELRVDIAPPADADLERVSQLTYRTNQFNFTTIRRSVADVREFMARRDAGALTVRVADRFGDYGLVGVVLYERAAGRVRVDTFLLSCRVLGRGVEHAVLAHLAALAVNANAEFVELEYQPTPRNAPAKSFVDALEYSHSGDGAARSYRARDLAQLAYTPASSAPDEAAADESEKPARATSAFSAAGRAEPLRAIAESLRTTDALMRAIELTRVRREPMEIPADGAPAGSVEATLLAIWRRVLGRAGVGINENFFEAGGTSLKAVQVLAAVKKEMGKSLSIVSLFESPTVALLAARIRGGETAPVAATVSDAMRRGQQRRQVGRRTAS